MGPTRHLKENPASTAEHTNEQPRWAIQTARAALRQSDGNVEFVMTQRPRRLGGDQKLWEAIVSTAFAEMWENPDSDTLTDTHFPPPSRKGPEADLIRRAVIEETSLDSSRERMRQLPEDPNEALSTLEELITELEGMRAHVRDERLDAAIEEARRLQTQLHIALFNQGYNTAVEEEEDTARAKEPMGMSNNAKKQYQRRKARARAKSDGRREHQAREAHLDEQAANQWRRTLRRAQDVERTGQPTEQSRTICFRHWLNNTPQGAEAMQAAEEEEHKRIQEVLKERPNKKVQAKTSSELAAQLLRKELKDKKLVGKGRNRRTASDLTPARRKAWIARRNGKTKPSVRWQTWRAGQSKRYTVDEAGKDTPDWGIDLDPSKREKCKYSGKETTTTPSPKELQKKRQERAKEIRRRTRRRNAAARREWALMQV